MPRIRSENLREGMVVSRDVKNIDGMLLASSGAVLSARQVTILQTWGVADIDVEGTEDDTRNGSPLSQMSPGELATLTNQLKDRFWNANALTPVESEIFQLMLLRSACSHCRH